MHHLSRPTALGALALTLALSAPAFVRSGPAPPTQSGAAGQDEPRDKAPDDRDLYPWSRITAKQDEALLERLQGAWQLVDLQSPQIDKARRSDVGFLIVAGHYLSFELHVGWQQAGPSRRPPLGSLHAGTHRLHLGPGARLALTSLIGTMIDSRGKTRAEPPGTQRLFNVEVLDNRLTLDRLDGYILTFVRMAESRQERDFYGRPIRKPQGEGESEK